MNSDELAERLLDFAARTGGVVDAMPDSRLGRHVAGQMVRSGTSAAANYEEGRAGESRADFIHKLGICLKELRETRMWLRLSAKAGLFADNRLAGLVDESEQLIRIVAKSVVTAKKNRVSEPAKKRI